MVCGWVPTADQPENPEFLSEKLLRYPLPGVIILVVKILSRPHNTETHSETGTHTHTHTPKHTHIRGGGWC